MFTDESFNIDDYILDECCEGYAYILIYKPSKSNKWLFLLMPKMTGTNILDLNQFNQASIIQTLSKSKSPYNLQKIEVKRGRKNKYTNDEERKEAGKR